MSDSNRGILAALAGIAALAVATGAGAFYGSLYSPAKKQYAAVDTGSAANETYRGVTKSLPDIALVPDQVERAIANPAPHSGEDHEKRDLAAQESMAAWTFYMTVFAGLTALVTFFGTILIWKQVSYTRRAVEDTSKATEAMLEANHIASSTAQQQLRAYLYVELKEAPYLVLGCRPKADFWLRNGGQTPAHNVTMVNGFSIGSYPFEGEPPPLDEAFFERGGTHPPGTSTIIRCQAPEAGITQPWIDAINEGTRRIVMYGMIRYEDVFGVEHYTRYRAEYGGPDTIEGDRVVWAKTGNDHT